MLGGHASGPAAVDSPPRTRDNRRSSARGRIASAPSARLSRDPCSRNQELQSSQNWRLGRAWEEMTVCPSLDGLANDAAGLFLANAAIAASRVLASTHYARAFRMSD